jgi:chaperonin GroES
LSAKACISDHSDGAADARQGAEAQIAALQFATNYSQQGDIEMATTSFTPLHDRILVRRMEEGESIRGGIIIPDSAKEKPQQGEVIAVGKGKSNDEGKVFPLDVKKGDTILFGKYSGTEIKLDGEEFLIMREEEVLGIVKK